MTPGVSTTTSCGILYTVYFRIKRIFQGKEVGGKYGKTNLVNLVIVGKMGFEFEVRSRGRKKI